MRLSECKCNALLQCVCSTRKWDCIESSWVSSRHLSMYMYCTLWRLLGYTSWECRESVAGMFLAGPLCVIYTIMCALASCNYRPPSDVVMHTCTQLSCTRILGWKGDGERGGGGRGTHFIYSEIERSVHPVYKLCSSCLSWKLDNLSTAWVRYPV